MLNKHFLGNQKAKARLFSAGTPAGRRAHAILLYGDSGLGKKTLARLLACRYIVSPDTPMDEGFFDTAPSRLIRADRHPDVQVLGLEGSIKVDHVRALVRASYIKPNQAYGRVCILADCDTMTPQAQNALLKTLEEPPANAAFILTAKSRESLLETILSRVQAIRIEPVSTEECIAYIHTVLPDANLDEVKRQASLYGGNIGKTLLALGESGDNPVGLIGDEILSALLKGSSYHIAAGFEKARADRKLFADTCSRLTQLLGDMLINPDPSNALSIRDIYKALTALDGAQRRMVFNPNLQVLSSWIALEATGKI